MTKKYVGCHSAAEAQGKVELWNSYLGQYDQVIYFDQEEDMLDYLAQRKNKDCIGYYRPLTDTGRYENYWQVVKTNMG